ncbi:Uncharacterised protein [Yersinia aldovae]|uniref:Uncharacterized protein n=1 Tax=Yersinia aldovae TaxID=29483 RepID=A0A0T9UXT9_YERAL|nr:Uncharacterised protein [Yersinia aldovae]CNL78878.1 Uncharacterised protein [Yersinia aldovae]
MKRNCTAFRLSQNIIFMKNLSFSSNNITLLIFSRSKRSEVSPERAFQLVGLFSGFYVSIFKRTGFEPTQAVEDQECREAYSHEWQAKGQQQSGKQAQGFPHQ